MAEKKCVPCLWDFDSLKRSLRLAEASIGERDKFRSDIHLMFSEGHLRRMEDDECMPKEGLEYMKSHIDEARKDLAKEDWSKAEWRARVVEGLALDIGLSHIIAHCRREVEK